MVGDGKRLAPLGGVGRVGWKEGLRVRGSWFGICAEGKIEPTLSVRDMLVWGGVRNGLHSAESELALTS